MAKPELKQGDKVLVIDLRDKEPGKRLHHRAVIDEIKSKSNKKVKLKKTDEEFDDKENKQDNPKRRLLRLKPEHIAQLTASQYITDLDSITGVNLDNDRLSQWDKDNDE